MPTHYEPLESPVKNALYSRDTNPVVNWFTRQENRFAPPGDPRFPFVLTTYRLTEHHTAGGMSRFLSHLAELQPELFAEMSPELAAELKINNGDYISIVSLRGAIESRALVSRRIRPMHLNGKTVHQIAMPFHSHAISSPADCPADPRSRSGLKNMCPRMARRICIRNNLRRAHPAAERLVVIASMERPTTDDRRRNPKHESAEAFLRPGSCRGRLLH